MTSRAVLSTHVPVNNLKDNQANKQTSGNWLLNDTYSNFVKTFLQLYISFSYGINSFIFKLQFELHTWIGSKRCNPKMLLQGLPYCSLSSHPYLKVVESFISQYQSIIIEVSFHCSFLRLLRPFS